MVYLFIPSANNANVRQSALAEHKNRGRTTRQGTYLFPTERFLRDHGSDLHPGLSSIRGLQNESLDNPPFPCYDMQTRT